MASPTEVELLKVLACVAWADEEVTQGEINFIKQFVRRFKLSGDDWAQVEMYLVEKVGVEEMKRIIQRFLQRARRPRQREMLVKAVEDLLQADDNLSPKEKEWLRDLKGVVSESKGASFYLDGLKSLLRIGGSSHDPGDSGREADLHDFISNRVLFRLRRRLGSERLEKEGTPAKLKKLTLSAALLGRVGYVDEEFLPQEKAFMHKVLHEIWGATQPMVEAVSHIALETVEQRVDLHRLVQEVKATMSMPERQLLVEGIFAMTNAEGKTSHEEIEEVRKIAYMLDFSHKQFINTKLKVLTPSRH